MTKRPAALPLAPKWPSSMMWKLGRIKPYPGNARTHPPDQIKFIAGIFRRLGADQPIVVDEDGVILKGHGRLEAAKEAKLDAYPVAQRFGLTEAQKAELRVADNQAGLMSGWDQDLLRAEVALLQEEGVELQVLGFADKFLDDLLKDPEPPGEFPEVGADLPTSFCCPRCRYAWSGNPLAGANRAAGGPPEEDKGHG